MRSTARDLLTLVLVGGLTFSGVWALAAWRDPFGLIMLALAALMTWRRFS
jgi:hypothetical protein